MKLRTLLTLLVAGAVVPVLVAAVIAGIVLARHERRNTERDAIRWARATMSAIDAELRGAMLTLEALAASKYLQGGDLAGFHAETRRVLLSQPHWTNIGLFSPAKVQLVDAIRPLSAPGRTVADPESLDRAIGGRQPVFGNVVSAREGASTVRMRLPVAQDGGLRYVLSVPLDTKLFTDVFRAQQLPADWVIVLVDRNRRFIARIPPRPPGDPISGSFRQALDRSPEGFFRGRTVEGFETFTPYVTSPLTGWVLGIAMPESEVTAAATRLAVTTAIGVVIALAVALALAWLVARRIVEPIGALASAANAIGRGERPAIPVGARVEEVRDVSRALGDASSAVRARQAELVQRSAQLEALAAVARTINTLDLDTALQSIAESARALLEAEVAAVFRLDEASGNMVLAGGGARGLTLTQDTVIVAGTGLVGLAVDRREAVVSDNVLADARIMYLPDMRERIAATSHRVGVAVPLTVLGRITGALFIGALPGRVFSAADVKLATMFADQAAVAMANAQLYHDAQRASRAKDEFLAMLGHELRNPLGAISTAVSLLGVAGGREATADRARAVIDRQTRHLSRLVDDLLDVSRATTGKAVLVREPLDFGELVTTVMNTWRSSGRFERHHVIVEVESVWVHADEARMEQIVSNLAGNALKYTPAGGRVTIRVTADDTTAILEVSDTGVGMPPELVGKAFDLFVQSERTLDRAQGGLGIGLTMVRALVEMHGGTVEARSEGLGQGSSLRVRLPRVGPGAAPRLAARTPETPAQPHRVLIVEDNDDAREMLRVQLSRDGHEVFEAADGQAGVDMATTVRPDVALIDLGLPNLDGYEVARRIRAAANGRSMLLVAVTGYGQAEDRRLARDAGFDAHLTKPVLPERLAQVFASRRD